MGVAFEDVGDGTGRRVCGVDVRSTSGTATRVPATCVVIAMGPWSSVGLSWFATSATGEPIPGSLPPGLVSGLKAHSIRVKPPVRGGAGARSDGAEIDATALFLEVTDAESGQQSSPEVYPRPDGEVYVCGGDDASAELPADPAHVAPDPRACEALERLAAVVAPASLSTRTGARVLGHRACFLPQSADGLPLLGRIPGSNGGWVAAGHGCWGILGAPATGQAMASAIVSSLPTKLAASAGARAPRRSSAAVVDLAPFAPARFLATK